MLLCLGTKAFSVAFARHVHDRGLTFQSLYSGFRIVAYLLAIYVVECGMWYFHGSAFWHCMCDYAYEINDGPAWRNIQLSWKFITSTFGHAHQCVSFPCYKLRPCKGRVNPIVWACQDHSWVFHFVANFHVFHCITPQTKKRSKKRHACRPPNFFMQRKLFLLSGPHKSGRRNNAKALHTYNGGCCQTLLHRNRPPG